MPARAFTLGHFAQAVRIRARRRSYHEHHVDGRARKGLHGRLAVLRRVADVLAARLENVGEALLQGGDRHGAVVGADRRLFVFKLQGLHVFGTFHENDAVVDLAHRPFDFGVACVADHDDGAPFLAHAADFAVNLGDERAGRVKDAKSSLAGLFFDGARHAVRREDDGRAFGNVREIVDEDGSALAQVFDDRAVVHDFVTDVDGGAVELERPLHDGDGARHARAETAGLSEENLHVGPRREGKEPKIRT